MATCPVCEHDLATPFFLNLDAWRHLVCPHCKARLEMKAPRSAVLGPLMAPLFVLARRGRVFEVIAFVFMFATIFLVLLESIRPKVQLRKKPLPKPTIRLNIDGPSN
jgi:uncharacterized protein YbaR (Trm112 family)